MINLAYTMEKNDFECLFYGNIVDNLINYNFNREMKGFNFMLNKLESRFVFDPYCPLRIKQEFRKTILKNVKYYYNKKENRNNADKNVLIYTHELSLTGAPIVLVHAARILKRNGWNVVVVSPVDGVLKEEFLNENIPVIVQGNIKESDLWLDYAKEFDLIFVNTIVSFYEVKKLEQFNVPVLWWLHDAKSGYEDYLKNVLPLEYKSNINIYSVSKYADDVVKYYRPLYNTKILRYGLKDIGKDICDMDNPFNNIKNKRIFVNVGSIIKRKGQDVLVEAIKLLPLEVMKRCIFIFVGKRIDNDIYIYIENICKEYPENVYYIEAVAHDKIFSLYKNATAVVCSSRDDPLPTFMAETMMVSGVCLCSKNTGTFDVISDGVNGFVYGDDNPQELADCICKIVNSNEIQSIKLESRKLFLDNFSIEIFEKNLLRCVEECLNVEN